MEVKNHLKRSDFKPFNTHLQVDYPAYAMVIFKHCKIKTLAIFW